MQSKICLVIFSLCLLQQIKCQESLLSIQEQARKFDDLTVEGDYSPALPLNRIGKGVDSVIGTRDECGSDPSCTGSVEITVDVILQRGYYQPFDFTDSSGITRKGSISIPVLTTSTDLAFGYFRNEVDLCHAFAVGENSVDYDKLEPGKIEEIAGVCVLSGDSRPFKYNVTEDCKVSSITREWVEKSSVEKRKCGYVLPTELKLRQAYIPVVVGTGGVAVYSSVNPSSVSGQLCVTMETTECVDIRSTDESIITVNTERISVNIKTPVVPTRIPTCDIGFRYSRDDDGSLVVDDVKISVGQGFDSPMIENSIGEFRSSCDNGPGLQICDLEMWDFSARISNQLHATSTVDMKCASMNKFFWDGIGMHRSGTCVTDQSRFEDSNFSILKALLNAALWTSGIYVVEAILDWTNTCYVSRVSIEPRKRIESEFSNWRDVKNFFPNQGFEQPYTLPSKAGMKGLDMVVNLTKFESLPVTLVIKYKGQNLKFISELGTVSKFIVDRCVIYSFSPGSFCSFRISIAGAGGRIAVRCYGSICPVPHVILSPGENELNITMSRGDLGVTKIGICFNDKTGEICQECISCETKDAPEYNTTFVDEKVSIDSGVDASGVFSILYHNALMGFITTIVMIANIVFLAIGISAMLSVIFLLCYCNGKFFLCALLLSSSIKQVDALNALEFLNSEKINELEKLVSEVESEDRVLDSILLPPLVPTLIDILLGSPTSSTKTISSTYSMASTQATTTKIENTTNKTLNTTSTENYMNNGPLSSLDNFEEYDLKTVRDNTLKSDQIGLGVIEGITASPGDTGNLLVLESVPGLENLISLIPTLPTLPAVTDIANLVSDLLPTIELPTISLPLPILSTLREIIGDLLSTLSAIPDILASTSKTTQKLFTTIKPVSSETTTTTASSTVCTKSTTRNEDEAIVEINANHVHVAREREIGFDHHHRARMDRSNNEEFESIKVIEKRKGGVRYAAILPYDVEDDDRKDDGFLNGNQEDDLLITSVAVTCGMFVLLCILVLLKGCKRRYYGMSKLLSVAMLLLVMVCDPGNCENLIEEKFKRLLEIEKNLTSLGFNQIKFEPLVEYCIITFICSCVIFTLTAFIYNIRLLISNKSIRKEAMKYKFVRRFTNNLKNIIGREKFENKYFEDGTEKEIGVCYGNSKCTPGTKYCGCYDNNDYRLGKNERVVGNVKDGFYIISNTDEMSQFQRVSNQEFRSKYPKDVDLGLEGVYGNVTMNGSRIIIGNEDTNIEEISDDDLKVEMRKYRKIGKSRQEIKKDIAFDRFKRAIDMDTTANDVESEIDMRSLDRETDFITIEDNNRRERDNKESDKADKLSDANDISDRSTTDDEEDSNPKKGTIPKGVINLKNINMCMLMKLSLLILIFLPIVLCDTKLVTDNKEENPTVMSGSDIGNLEGVITEESLGNRTTFENNNDNNKKARNRFIEIILSDKKETIKSCFRFCKSSKDWKLKNLLNRVDSECDKQKTYVSCKELMSEKDRILIDNVTNGEREYFRNIRMRNIKAVGSSHYIRHRGKRNKLRGKSCTIACLKLSILNKNKWIRVLFNSVVTNKQIDETKTNSKAKSKHILYKRQVAEYTNGIEENESMYEGDKEVCVTNGAHETDKYKMKSKLYRLALISLICAKSDQRLMCISLMLMGELSGVLSDMKDKKHFFRYKRDVDSYSCLIIPENCKGRQKSYIIKSESCGEDWDFTCNSCRARLTVEVNYVITEEFKMSRTFEGIIIKLNNNVTCNKNKLMRNGRLYTKCKLNSEIECSPYLLKVINNSMTNENTCRPIFWEGESSASSSNSSVYYSITSGNLKTNVCPPGSCATNTYSLLTRQYRAHCSWRTCEICNKERDVESCGDALPVVYWQGKSTEDGYYFEKDEMGDFSQNECEEGRNSNAVGCVATAPICYVIEDKIVPNIRNCSCNHAPVDIKNGVACRDDNPRAMEIIIDRTNVEETYKVSGRSCIYFNGSTTALGYNFSELNQICTNKDPCDMPTDVCETRNGITSFKDSQRVYMRNGTYIVCPELYSWIFQSCCSFEKCRLTVCNDVRVENLKATKENLCLSHSGSFKICGGTSFNLVLNKGEYYRSASSEDVRDLSSIDSSLWNYDNENKKLWARVLSYTDDSKYENHDESQGIFKVEDCEVSPQLSGVGEDKDSSDNLMVVEANRYDSPRDFCESEPLFDCDNLVWLVGEVPAQDPIGTWETSTTIYRSGASTWEKYDVLDRTALLTRTQSSKLEIELNSGDYFAAIHWVFQAYWGGDKAVIADYNPAIIWIPLSPNIPKYPTLETSESLVTDWNKGKVMEMFKLKSVVSDLIPKQYNISDEILYFYGEAGPFIYYMFMSYTRNDHGDGSAIVVGITPLTYKKSRDQMIKVVSVWPTNSTTNMLLIQSAWVVRQVDEDLISYNKAVVNALSTVVSITGTYTTIVPDLASHSLKTIINSFITIQCVDSCQVKLKTSDHVHRQFRMSQPTHLDDFRLKKLKFGGLKSGECDPSVSYAVIGNEHWSVTPNRGSRYISCLVTQTFENGGFSCAYMEDNLFVYLQICDLNIQFKVRSLNVQGNPSATLYTRFTTTFDLISQSEGAGESKIVYNGGQPILYGGAVLAADVGNRSVHVIKPKNVVGSNFGQTKNLRIYGTDKVKQYVKSNSPLPCISVTCLWKLSFKLFPIKTSVIAYMGIAGLCMILISVVIQILMIGCKKVRNRENWSGNGVKKTMYMMKSSRICLPFSCWYTLALYMWAEFCSLRHTLGWSENKAEEIGMKKKDVEMNRIKIVSNDEDKRNTSRRNQNLTDNDGEAINKKARGNILTDVKEREEWKSGNEITKGMSVAKAGDMKSEKGLEDPTVIEMLKRYKDKNSTNQNTDVNGSVSDYYKYQ